MRLTKFFDFTLRVLMYAAATDDRLVTIEETAKLYDVSRAHLMKVVNMLTRTGYLKAVRGRSGGFMLARPAEEINLGALLRVSEPDFALVECFGPDNQCAVSNICRLPNVLNEALNAFVSTLDRYTLADIMLTRRDFDAPRPGKFPTRGPTISPLEALNP